jgi:multidrug efflux pump subunit AcrA (membrane-fusion protein)
VKSNEVVQSNLGAAVLQAGSDLAIAKRNFDRASELVKDNIISEKEFLETKRQFENAQTQLANVSVSKKFNQNKQSVTTPIRGFLKNVMVENGQFVNAGQPLATISKNKRLLLKANVSQKYFPKLTSFTAANFKTADGGQVFNTRNLNGRVVSTGKSDRFSFFANSFRDRQQGKFRSRVGSRGVFTVRHKAHFGYPYFSTFGGTRHFLCLCPNGW